nr:HAD-IC family P-type ATPase [Corynebacterium ciconiae]
MAALPLALKKLDPRQMVKTPVMFLVELGSVFTLVLAIANPSVFTWSVTIWLFFTVLFANLSEAIAEGRGKAQAEALRATKVSSIAQRVSNVDEALAGATPITEEVPGDSLHPGDVVCVYVEQVIPGDGDVIYGAALVDESAVTGESAPVIRESGGDRCAVTGGTRVLSDEILVSITSEPGETFIDRMIALVEGAERKKTPNELALGIVLNVLTLIFLAVVLALAPMASFTGAEQDPVVLVALLVCLIPTTIGALLSAIGIAGMDRLVQRNVLAMSGRAVEAAGDVSTLLLDKTGTITKGDRQAARFLPVPGVEKKDLATACQLSSLADETPEGRSIVKLSEEQVGQIDDAVFRHGEFIPFTAQTRMSGMKNSDGSRVLKGAASEMVNLVQRCAGEVPEQTEELVNEVSNAGGTALVVIETGPIETGTPKTGTTENAGVVDLLGEWEGMPSSAKVLGVIDLKDIVKDGMVERFRTLRSMGIRTVMITGDNELTARAIAKEAGVDDYLAEATPDEKLALIRREQEGGRMVAMTGDGTNDAPALAQADVGVAMNTGTMAAKEAGNMVDLDSNPTKLIEIVEIGKQLLITRGALTTFSIANDVAKYFAIIPAMFVLAIPGMDALNIMHLHSPTTAILSAVIFNALIIIALIPLALKGVRYTPSSASALLSRNLLIFGLGGVIAPFIGIKIIDIILTLLGMS